MVGAVGPPLPLLKPRFSAAFRRPGNMHRTTSPYHISTEIGGRLGRPHHVRCGRSGPTSSQERGQGATQAVTSFGPAYAPARVAVGELMASLGAIPGVVRSDDQVSLTNHIVGGPCNRLHVQFFSRDQGVVVHDALVDLMLEVSALVTTWRTSSLSDFGVIFS